MRKAVCLGLALLLCALTVCGMAEGATSTDARGVPAANEPLIIDDAGLFAPHELTALREAMLPLSAYGKPVLWTTEKKGTAEYLCRLKYGETVGLGESGALFMINMNTRTLYLGTDGAIGQTITVSDALDLVDNVYRLAGRSYYAHCAIKLFTDAERLMERGKILRPLRVVGSALIALSLSLLITTAIVLAGSGLKAIRKKARLEARVHPSTRVVTLAAGAFAMQETRRVLLRRERIESSSGGSGGHYHGGRGGGSFHGGGGRSGGSFHGGGHRF